MTRGYEGRIVWPRPVLTLPSSSSVAKLPAQSAGVDGARLLAAAALVLGASIAMFLVVTWRALSGVPSTSPTIRGLKFALFGLAGAVGLGIVLALALARGWAVPWLALTDLHAAWALGGWAGILLAAAVMLTRRLWLSIGFHMAWNYTQSAIFSGIVSGNDAAPGWIRSTIKGPDYLTGGQFGVESSVLALVLCTTTGIVMLVMAQRRGLVVPPAWKRQQA